MISNNDLVCLRRVIEKDHEDNIGSNLEDCNSSNCFQKRIIAWIDSLIVQNANKLRPEHFTKEDNKGMAQLDKDMEQHINNTLDNGGEE